MERKQSNTKDGRDERRKWSLWNNDDKEREKKSS